METRQKSIIIFVFFAVTLYQQAAGKGDVVTFETHVRPILQTRCFSCHNPDKKRGGLDLTSYDLLLSPDAKVITPGRPNDSLIVGVIEHTREPKMPPEGSKLSESEIGLIRTWIEQGCRKLAGESTSEEHGALRHDPAGVGSLGEISIRLPLAWPLFDITHTERKDAVRSLAYHPDLPVVALTAQQQVLIYHVPSQTLLGALATRPAFPIQVRFSADGGLLIAAGGVAADSGFVRAWDVNNGCRVINIDHPRVAVRTADIDAERRWCAFGGPSGVVNVYDLTTMKPVHQFEKHTDWITDVQFSPDGLLLATADRAGGVFVWEAESRNLMHALPTHGGAVTSISWRGDSNRLATTCEDGRIRVFEPEGGSEIKSWVAHPNGALCVRWSRDGRLVTVGRDRLAKTWKADFSPESTQPAFDDVALACAFGPEGKQIVASDYGGDVRVYDAQSNTVIAQLESNPPPLDSQLALARRNHEEAAGKLDQEKKKLIAAKAEFERANKAVEQSIRRLTDDDLDLKRLLAAETRHQLDLLRIQLADVKRRNKPVFDAASAAEAAVSKTQAALAAAKTELDALDRSIESHRKERSTAAQQLTSQKQSQSALQKRFDENLAALEKLKHTAESVAALPESEAVRSTREHIARATEALTTEISELRTQLDSASKEIESSTTAVASLQSQENEGRSQRSIIESRIGELEQQLQQAVTDAAAHRKRADEARKGEADLETRIKSLTASYQAILTEAVKRFK